MKKILITISEEAAKKLEELCKEEIRTKSQMIELLIKKNTKKMKKLEELKNFINSNEDWSLTVNEVIKENGWKDKTDEKYGICEDEKGRILEFNNNMEAIIKE